MNRRRHASMHLCAGLVLVAGAARAAPAAAQQEPMGAFARDPYAKNVPYDGRLTLARIRYSTGPGGSMDQFGRGRFDPKWDHD